MHNDTILEAKGFKPKGSNCLRVCLPESRGEQYFGSPETHSWNVSAFLEIRQSPLILSNLFFHI